VLATDGGLTEAQAALLNELYILEGRLEHASPDVEAEEVRDGIERRSTSPTSTSGYRQPACDPISLAPLAQQSAYLLAALRRAF
jgi:hypothetical protein